MTTIINLNPRVLPDISSKAEIALLAFIQKICKLKPDSTTLSQVEQFTKEFQSKLPSPKALKALSASHAPELWLSQPRISELQTPEEINKLIETMKEYPAMTTDFQLRLFRKYCKLEVKQQFTEQEQNTINQAARKVTGDQDFDCFSPPEVVSEQTLNTEESLREEIDLLENHGSLFNAYNFISNDGDQLPEDTLFEKIVAAENELLLQSSNGELKPRDFNTTLELADAKAILNESGIVNAFKVKALQTVFDWMDSNFKLAAGEDQQALAEYRNKALACFPQEAAGRLRASLGK